MAITEEKSLMTSEKFNRGVENWTWKVRNTSVNILQRTHATGRLRRELQSRWLKDREGGPAYVGLGFRFARYGAYREYGAGRGYIVKTGILLKRHSAWSDKTKRPEMADAACRYSDHVILTSDNPRSEDPEQIIRDMLTGVKEGFQYRVEAITDRKEAIRKAIGMASKGDIILVAGKGHENYQEVKGVKHHFDDKEVIREIFDLSNR